MQTIKLEESNAEIRSVNQRAEKHGDQKKIAVDVDITTETPVDFLHQLAIENEQADFSSLLFDDKNNVIALGLKTLVFDREYKDQTVIITLEDLRDSNVTLHDVKIKKFSAVPVYGKRIKLSLQIQCMPDDEQLVFLAHAHTKNGIIFEIIESKQPDLLDEADEADETED